MEALAREEGRHLGGRPPYGYRLADAGPHPNRAHAAWGRRLHKLEPDPATAPHAKWIFTQRLAGHSVASIARTLNERAVPCPSGADPNRNRHRTGEAWTLRTVAAILSNPRYTGQQVWNRQPTDHTPITSNGRVGGEREIRRWSPATQWVFSKRAAHAALVSEADFIAAQAVTAVPVPKDGSSRTYHLIGLLVCGFCARRMESHWVHGRAGYRCRHGHTSAKPSGPRPRNLYLREDHIIDRVRLLLPAHSAPLAGWSPSQIAAHLRRNNLAVVCNIDQVTLRAEPTAAPSSKSYRNELLTPDASQRCEQSSLL